MEILLLASEDRQHSTSELITVLLAPIITSRRPPTRFAVRAKTSGLTQFGLCNQRLAGGVVVALKSHYKTCAPLVVPQSLHLLLAPGGQPGGLAAVLLAPCARTRGKPPQKAPADCAMQAPGTKAGVARGPRGSQIALTGRRRRT